MEQNEVFKKAAEEALNKLTFIDKCVAAGMISGDESYFRIGELEMSDEHKKQLDLLLLKQMIINGPQGVMMAVRVGRARVSSIVYPIKKKTGLAQRFKDKIKEWLQ